MPGLTIGDTLPDLELETTHGNSNSTISWPTTATASPSSSLIRGTSLLHKEWIKDIEAYNKGHRVNYPIAADPTRRIIKQLNMVDPDEKDSSGQQTPSRALHIVGADKKIKLSFLYPASTGRNMDEVLRVVDSLQKAAQHKIATPANWKPGDPVVISPTVTNQEAEHMFPQGYQTAQLPSNKDYLRFTNISP
ncbi:UNVERIFIED_CONTAM: 1-Cys peroxiredoxin [Sesamum calycinum]|uniref:Peroxiredoxin n=1 Tax=Sesamum calycinum TaxID=2727403 RepID=A0AAW2R827_9LAMI